MTLELPLPVAALGAIIGMVYGMVAVGLVLIYRSNQIINFAHGEIGALGASALGLAVVEWHVPYWVALLGALLVSATVGGLVEVAVVRRLRKAPKLMSIVATLGAAQFLLMLSTAMNSEIVGAHLFPQPPFLPEFSVGSLLVTPAYFAMLVLSPTLVIVLAIFLRRSRTGVAMRASAANPEAARMVGIFSPRMSLLAWGIASAFACFTAVLLLPTRGFGATEALGPGLLLRALVAGVLARMTNLPVAFAAGIGLGVIEQGLLWNSPSGGVVEAVLFVVLIGALLLQSRQALREQESGSWAAVEPWPALPEAWMKVWSVRNLGRIAAAGALAIAVCLPLWVTSNAAVILVAVITFGLVGVSLGIVTGLSGQLSFGQFAFAGIGAAVSYHVTFRTGNFAVALLAAGIAAGLASAVVGIPALRIRGLLLAVTTLSFALMAQGWLFQQEWMLGDGVAPGRPIIGTLALESGKSYYYFVLVVSAITLWFVRNLRAGGFGRILVAVRDNEDAARAFSVSAGFRKVQAFVVAGFLAGIGGALFGHALSRISLETFPPTASINVVAMTVLGGIGILVGPIIGALYIIGVPAFIPLDAAGLAASSFGWLVLILYFPGGIAQLLRPLRARVVQWLVRRSGIDDAGDASGLDGQPSRPRRPRRRLAAAFSRRRAQRVDWSRPPGAGPRSASVTGEETTGSSSVDPGASAELWRRLLTDRAGTPEADPAAGRGEDTPILQVSRLSKTFGGIAAVQDVAIEVTQGQTVGIIGPNGAGKTTLFDLVSGFVRPDAGTVVFAGTDVTTWSPQMRAWRGLVRSFQQGQLFETMTVLDTLCVAQERSHPTHIGSSALGLRKVELLKQQRARDLAALMGLDRYRHTPIRELSTGTRRIAELACLVALEPSLLLLDEPSAGIAQRETEALGDLLRRLKTHLQATVLIIEHDMPMIMSLADRVIAMESGKVIHDGTPDSAQSDPSVIESYLGGDPQTIHRSGEAAASSEQSAAIGASQT